MNDRHRRIRPAVKAAAVSLGLVLTGCAGSGTAGSGGSGGGNFFSNMFGGGSTTPTGQPVATAQTLPAGPGGRSLAECPDVEVDRDAATIRVHAGKETPANLRYQATIRKLARECWRRGTAGAVKLGVAGRVVLGPKGRRGKYTVPIQVRVLDGTEEIYSKTVRVPLTVQGGGSGEFAHVAPNITFPLASANDSLSGYRISVGFNTGRKRR